MINKHHLYSEVNQKLGIENQLIVFIEEMAEVQKEACKLLRKDNQPEIIDFAYELADLHIMIEQMAEYFNITEVVNDAIGKKLSRLNERSRSYGSSS